MAIEPSNEDLYEAGLAARKKVLGEQYVNPNIEKGREGSSDRQDPDHGDRVLLWCLDGRYARPQDPQHAQPRYPDGAGQDARAEPHTRGAI